MIFSRTLHLIKQFTHQRMLADIFCAHNRDLHIPLQAGNSRHQVFVTDTTATATRLNDA